MLEDIYIKYHFHSWKGIKPLRLDSVCAAFLSRFTLHFFQPLYFSSASSIVSFLSYHFQRMIYLFFFFLAKEYILSSTQPLECVRSGDI